ncbi:uncharacterized protein Z519_10937 [Cladophialophora bantiana CBS 173.52]|uniref:Sister chromatid cohesion and DNA repair protein (BimD) n=1 Tax=Cladophialophora bantiana (strain ATCC 10958 / CBS 173.52 / CDC B-1940 / NIH 8579) TaxID=1442370 RepID=A0A0D2H4Z0_CLAB1|nr:uncharacterized protein Z519_10937 [Cladophialophora bantiana CBS 173.52]KIW88368.1 hypothetical protein Z519_10937 [Cladophialophora bantiana CBS 173.52]
MPSRPRNAAAAEAVQSQRRYDIPGLQFEDTLTWRAGKPIAVGDLLTRLQKLAGQLRHYDLDEVDSRAFTTLAHDLANPNLLGHKDKGVRAWTVSCIVDVLKICAPDAPFIEGQLKDIFTVIINSILPALADPTNAYNAQHVYILNSLAESQSILLVTDIPNHETLITSLFTTAFDIVAGSGNNSSGVEVSKSVEYHLKNLLAAVVDEVTLPQEVTDIIISQFMRVDTRNAQDHGTKGKKRDARDSKQGTLLLKEYPPAYNMAKSLCTTCPEKMTAHITQYFGTVIVDATAANDVPQPSHRRTASDLDGDGEEREGLADLRKAHRLLRELWRACPDVLLNVIPQIEEEFSADSPSLRRLATETVGDITAGIGIAGLPPSVRLDPAAYPLPSIDRPRELPAQTTNPLLTPASPKPFMAVHAATYRSFLGRRNDKSYAVREAWANAAGRILRTSAGGIGLNPQELEDLLSGFAQMLRDPEEHVRLAAIQSVDNFPYEDMINILGADGGLAEPYTVFSSLAERVIDRKHHVREAAFELLGRIWGVGSRDIESGSEVVKSTIGEIPNRIFGAYFTNEPHVHAVIDRVLYESLLPLSFPPSKVQISRSESQQQRAKGKDGGSQEESVFDPDAIRARRILTLVRSLDTRPRAVFYSLQNRQVQMSKGIRVFLETCEAYNGGVVDDGSSEAALEERLTRMIEQLSKSFPDPAEFAADLWRFAKQHNRRWYQLIRFATGPEHDYRTVTNAMKELIKRIREAPSTLQSLVDTIQSVFYRCALLVYNRSHVPTIMAISRTDESGLGEVAHEVLKEISARNPEVLKYHIQTLCKELEDEAPAAIRPEQDGAPDTLKACAAFARKYPLEMPKERKFLTALAQFALFSKSPRAAKHAVTIIMMAADKKEMYAKDLLTKALKVIEPDNPHFLARLAAIAQVCLLAPAAAKVDLDAIQELAVSKILLQNQSPSKKNDPSAWDERPDDETRAKELALRILVNRCRAQDETTDTDEFVALTKETLKHLTALIQNEGEITPSKDTPPSQKNRLRLIAAHLILKLCSHKRKCDDFIDPRTFISIVMIIINPPNPVRAGFVNSLKKYLGLNRLHHRWFTALFLLAFEPDTELRTSTVTWIRARVQFFARQQLQASPANKKGNQNVMESTFARLLSLLAHHPDYPAPHSADFEEELLDFAKYIVFYLWAVATEDNLSLIFHIAQRVKAARDGITGTDEASERLYVLSDLSQAVIRNYADIMPTHARGFNLLQTWPGKVSLPRNLFKSLPSHEAAQEIAEKNYLPEDVAIGLEKMIRSYIKELKNASRPPKRAVVAEKKRNSDAAGLNNDEDDWEGRKKAAKRPKKSTLAIRRTPKPKRRSSELANSPNLPSRKSTRTSNVVSYAESDTEDGDVEMKDMKSPARSPTARKRVMPKKREPDEDQDQPENGDGDNQDESEDTTHEEPRNNVERPAQERGPEDPAHVDEDENAAAAAVSENDDEMAEKQDISRPSRDKRNAVAGKKGRGKKTTTRESTVAKQKTKPAVRTTRQTRSTKT